MHSSVGVKNHKCLIELFTCSTVKLKMNLHVQAKLLPDTKKKKRTFGIQQGHQWCIAESRWPAASWLTEATAAHMLKIDPATVTAKPLE